jgi:SNF2 family DNA or RNA helicase
MHLFSDNFKEGYSPGNIENSAKTSVLFTLLEETVKNGDRILLMFSQNLATLDLLEEILQKRKIPGASLDNIFSYLKEI